MRFLTSALLCAALLLPSNTLALSPEEATTDFCNCAGDMFKDINKMMESLQAGDFSKIEAMQADMEKKQAEVQTCMAALEKKYESKKEDKEFEEKVKAGIDKKCPLPKMAPGMGMPGGPPGGAPGGAPAN